jgi:hypothetical protein
MCRESLFLHTKIKLDNTNKKHNIRIVLFRARFVSTKKHITAELTWGETAAKPAKV